MVRMSNVSVTYRGGVTALRSITAVFGPGQFTVLLGPSGSGKSTLLRCLNYLVRPSFGYVSVEGLGNLDDGRLLRRHRRRTAMIFQQHQLIGRRTVFENVLIGRLGYHSSLRSLFPLPKAEQLIAFESIDRVGLLHKATERADNLSGGEQQRVGIARALAQKPQIILADEPIASLDPASADKVLSLLYDICREGAISAIVSLHQVQMAIKFADRIVGLASGRVVFDGRPEECTENIIDRIYRSNAVNRSSTFDPWEAGHGDASPDLAAVEP